MRPLKQRLRSLFSRNLSIFLSAASLILVLAVAACTNTESSLSSSALPKEFRIGYQIIPNAELLAKNLDLVEAQFPDIRVKWIPFSSGRNVLLAIANNKIDVGLAGSVPAATAIAQGLPVRVYFIHDIIGDNEALAVKTTANIQSLADLAGKRIGVPFGSTTHFSLLSALAKANVAAENVAILDMQPNNILSAWKRDTIDGAFIWQPTLRKLEENQGNILLTAKELAKQGIITADLGVVSQQFASTYPNFLASYVGVLDEAVQQYRNDPAAAAAAIAPEVSLSPQEAISVMKEIIWLDAEEQTSQTYIGTAKAPGNLSKVLEASAKFMVEQNAIPPAPPLAAFQAGLSSQPLEKSLKQKT